MAKFNESDYIMAYESGEWFIDNGATEHIKFFDGIELNLDNQFNNPSFCKDCGIEFDLDIDNPLCLCSDCLKQHNESEG